jgi:hypothetical protein
MGELLSSDVQREPMREAGLSEGKKEGRSCQYT